MFWIPVTAGLLQPPAAPSRAVPLLHLQRGGSGLLHPGAGLGGLLYSEGLLHPQGVEVGCSTLGWG